jgi:hypothetical protein
MLAPISAATKHAAVEPPAQAPARQAQPEQRRQIGVPGVQERERAEHHAVQQRCRGQPPRARRSPPATRPGCPFLVVLCLGVNLGRRVGRRVVGGSPARVRGARAARARAASGCSPARARALRTAAPARAGACRPAGSEEREPVDDPTRCRRRTARICSACRLRGCSRSRAGAPPPPVARAAPIGARAAGGRRPRLRRARSDPDVGTSFQNEVGNSRGDWPAERRSPMPITTSSTAASIRSDRRIRRARGSRCARRGGPPFRQVRRSRARRPGQLSATRWPPRAPSTARSPG